MKVPEGVKVYGSGRISAKAGQELPDFLKQTKGFEDTVIKAGEKYAKAKSKKGKSSKPVELPFPDSASKGNKA